MNVLPVILILLLTPNAGSAVQVSTDKILYLTGQTVTITVKASADSMVWLFVDKPDSRNLYASPIIMNQSEIQIKVPLAKNLPEGNYTVTVTCQHTIARTFFYVESIYMVPEFNALPLVAILAVGLVAAFIRCRKSRR